MMKARTEEEVRMLELSGLIEYDGLTGQILWKSRPQSMFPSHWSFMRWNERYAGKPAGRETSKGAILMFFKKRPVLAHRIAFYLLHGYCPEQVDHKDGNPGNNRADNLRAASGSQNCCNRGISARNTSGVKGVSLEKKTGLWKAYIKVGGKQTHLGRFPTLEEAAEARRIKAAEAHGEFARETE